MTLIFYNLIIISSTFLIWISERSRKNANKLILLSISFLIIFLPSAFRYEIGGDYFSYKIIFDDIKSGVPSSMTEGIEPGYYYLNYLFSVLGLSFEWLVATIAFIITFFFYKSYPEKHKYLFHFILWTNFYFFSFSLLRSMLSASILLFAIMSYIKDKKYFNYFLLTILASTLHKSAILFLILPVISNLKIIKSIFNSRYILVFVILFSMLFSEKIIYFIFKNPLVNFLGYSQYAETTYNSPTELNSGLGVLSMVLILSYTTFISRDEFRKRNIFLLIITICSISIILASQIEIFGRLKMLFLISYPIVILLLMTHCKNLITVFFILFFISISIFNFNRLILSGSTDYRITCHNTRITPYVSIFNKSDSNRHPHLTRYLKWCNDHFDKGK